MIAVLSILIAIAISVYPIKAEAEWKQDSRGWWYSNGNLYYTGWKLIDNNWYYFYSDGYMAVNDKIGEYFVNSTGAWTNAITESEAEQLIWNEDGDYLSTFINCGGNYIKYEGECNTEKYYHTWKLPYEDAYEFWICETDYGDVTYAYVVGKESKNVYVFPNQGGSYVYKVQDNKVVSRFRDRVCPYSYGWR